MSQAGKEYEQRLAESEAREDELRRQLKYAQLERSAATAEVEAVRDSLKESQAALDTTRRMLEQQSEDHGKVLRVLNLELLEAQERASRSKHSQRQLQERVELLQQQLSDLAVSHPQQEKHLTERLGSVQPAYPVLASRDQEDQEAARRASITEREAASEAALGVHAVAADLASCVDIYTSQRLDKSGSGATSEPVAGHVGAEAASRAEVEAARAPPSTLQGVDGESAAAAPDALGAALASNAAAAVAETSRLKAKTVAIKATAYKTEADGSGARKGLGRGSSKASAGACDVALLQKHLSELRGELASYKDAARRLEHENSLLKHPRAIVSPMVKRNLGAEGSGAPRHSPSTAQPAHTAVPASSASGGGSAAGARPLPHASGLSSAWGQGVATSDNAGMVPRTSIPKNSKTVPAFKKVEAAAGLILPCPAPPLSHLLFFAWARLIAFLPSSGRAGCRRRQAGDTAYAGASTRPALLTMLLCVRWAQRQRQRRAKLPTRRRHASRGRRGVCLSRTPLRSRRSSRRHRPKPGLPGWVRFCCHVLCLFGGASSRPGLPPAHTCLRRCMR